MRLKPTSRAEFCDNPRNRLYLAYVERVGELAQPKNALKVLRDDVRMQAYGMAIQRCANGALDPAWAAHPASRTSLISLWTRGARCGARKWRGRSASAVRQGWRCRCDRCEC